MDHYWMEGDITKGWLAVAGSIITKDGVLSTTLGIGLGRLIIYYYPAPPSF